MKKFFGFFILLTYFLNANEIFTKEELLWMKNNPVIKVGADEKWPPFEYIDKKGNYKGVGLDYLKIITQKTGLKFDIKFNDWAVVMKDLKEGKVDILACAIQRENRKSFLNFTKPYLEVDDFVISKKNIKIKKMEDLKNLRAAVIRQGNVYKKLRKIFPKMKFVSVKNNLEGLKSIVNSQADFIIGDVVVLQHMIEKNFFTNLEVKFNSEFKKKKISIAVRKEKELLFNIINKVFDNISAYKMYEINKKWIFAEEDKNSKINFSKKELEWIKQHKEIKVVTDPTWYPFSQNNNGNIIGIIPDIIDLVAKTSKLNFQYINTKSWKESLTLIKEKKADMVDTVVVSDLRKNIISQSKPFLSSYMVIVGRKNEKEYYSDFKQLIKNSNNKKLGLMNGYTTTLKIKKEYPNLKNIIIYNNLTDSLKDLARAKIDYTVINFPNFEYFTKKYSLSNLKVLGLSGYVNQYAFGVGNKESELLSILNKILDFIPKYKIDAIYRKWVNIEYEPKVDYTLILQILLIVGVILFIIIYWNRKLKQQIIAKEKAQEELKENKDFIHAIMDSQVSLVFTKEKKRLIQANRAFLNFFKCKDIEEFKEKYNCVSDLFVAKDNKYLTANNNGKYWLEDILKNSKVEHKVLISKDNRDFIFKVTAAHVSEEKSIRTVVFTDITQLENLSELLHEAKEEALNLAKQRSEFLANMSHEIRTPMNSVIGFTEILEKEIVNPIHKEYLLSIKKGGNSLLRIINDILDLSKIEAGKFEIRKENIELREIFSEIATIFHSKVMGKNIVFTIDIDESIPKYIILDGIRLRQILFNLIGNAIKFTEEGYIKLKVIKIDKDDDKHKIDLVIEVKDSGVGIDTKNLKNIFMAFEQQKNQNVSKYGGTGLGLAICSKLVKMMNGEISVTSQKNKGSCFKVVLKDIDIVYDICKKEKEIKNILDFEFEEANILVVDDIKENRILLKAFLKDYDFNIVTAENGKEAIEKLRDYKIDFIFMDLRMPVLNGYEAANIIKNDQALQNIPLVALTASVMQKDLKKVSDFGFDDYLRKPIILKDLIICMSKYLSYKKVTNEEIIYNQENILDAKNVNLALEKLDNGFKIELFKVKDSGDFLRIEEFANKLLDLGRNKDIYLLDKYAKDLLKSIEIFDIEKVDYLLNTYENLLENLRIELEKSW